MHGLFGSYEVKTNWDLTRFAGSNYVTRDYETDVFALTQVTLPKFLSDKYFMEHDDCFIATEGVLFEADSPEQAIACYRSGETVFWKHWRGSFCGVLYDKKAERLIVFNDQIGSKMLFYSFDHGEFVFASDLQILAQHFDNRLPQETFIKALLDRGYSSDAKTAVQGIFRLTAGDYIQIEKGHFIKQPYYRFDNTPRDYDEETMLSETNRLFRQAVARVVKKNESEGLQHYFPLSGGLDSRLCQFVAHEIATAPIVNYTYSQRGHYDHVLPQEISRALGNKWQFMALDGGDYLRQIDAIAGATEWLINYNGPSEIYAFASQQDWTHKGIVLTGVNGDNILSVITDHRHEIGLLYSLSFAGNGLGSPLVLQHYTESYSPFCDVDVLDYVLHIPTKKRHNYRFYDRLLLRYYPQAAEWHHKHEQIGHRQMIVTLAGRDMPLRDVPKRMMMYLLKQLHLYDAYSLDGESMNPYDQWIKSNPQLAECFNEYYAQNKHLLSPRFAAECETMMRIGSVTEKNKVLTVLSALKALSGSGE